MDYFPQNMATFAVFFPKTGFIQFTLVFCVATKWKLATKNSAREVELFSSFKQWIGCQMNQKLKRKFRTIFERNVFSLCHKLLGWLWHLDLPSASFPQNLDLDNVDFVYKLVPCINTSIKDPARLVWPEATPPIILVGSIFLISPLYWLEP
jgi:hypothetical protein